MVRLLCVASLVALGCGSSGAARDPDAAGDDAAGDDAAIDALSPDGPSGPAAPLAHASIACREARGDYLEDVVVHADGAITAVGYTRVYFGTTMPTTDALIMRMAPSGQVLWQKRLGGASDDAFVEVVVLPGGGVMAVGNTSSHGNSGQGWLVKLDASGAITSETVLGGTSYDELAGVLPTADGGHLLVGLTSSFGATGYDAWAVKLASGGSVQWQKRFGDQTSAQDRFYAAAEIAGDFYIAGRTASFGTTYDDLWALRLTAAGDVTWQHKYNVGIDDRVHAVVPTFGGVILAGETNNAGWVTKLLLPSGDVTWSKLIDNTLADTEVVFAAQPDGNHGVVLAGYSFYTSQSAQQHDYDFWLMNLGHAGDQTIWSHTLGGANAEWARGLAKHPAGGYVAVGWTASFAGVPLEPGSWLLAISDAGTTTTACDAAHRHPSSFTRTGATTTRVPTAATITATTATPTAVASTINAAAMTCAPTSCAQ